MICLLVSPGVSLPTPDVALLIKKLSSGEENASKVISSIQFALDDQTKVSSSLSIAEQCQHAILQIPSNQESLQDIKRISIVWFCGEEKIGLNSDDGIGMASLFQFVTLRFQFKDLTIISDDYESIKDVGIFCFATVTTYAMVFFKFRLFLI